MPRPRLETRVSQDFHAVIRKVAREEIEPALGTFRDELLRPVLDSAAEGARARGPIGERQGPRDRGDDKTWNRSGFDRQTAFGPRYARSNP